MKRAVTSVTTHSAPVEEQLADTVKTHIVVKNFRGILEDAKSGNFDHVIMTVQSKPIPMQTHYYKGSSQMMTFGVEISKIEGLHHKDTVNPCSL